MQAKEKSNGRTPHVVAIIQARMGSSRFPGKSLADLCGRPMLWRVFERARRAEGVDNVVIATTDRPADNELAQFCSANNIPCFRGSEEDVLDRFYRTAQKFQADTVVRITADCPLIDPKMIGKVLARYLQGNWDYVSNALRYTYPDGLDVEAFSFAALQQAWREAKRPSDREHVTPYLRVGNFRVCNVENERPFAPGIPRRWTVDYPSDLDFVRLVYECVGEEGDFEAVLNLLERDPELKNAFTPRISNEGYYRSLFREAVAESAQPLCLKESQAWLARSLKIIPSGAQTFSKKYTQYVQGVAPVFLQSGSGCRVRDVDGNCYIDYVQGLLPNILGYANADVNRAVAEQLNEGHSFSLPHPLEVRLAERLKALIPCAEMVRFGKNGSDATAGAVRVSRAFTGRDRIATCGYHGWQDWYIGSTSRNAGVPAAVRNLTSAFHYNDIASLQDVFAKHPGEFAAVIMEPFNFVEPAPGFLESVREMAHKNGALLIFDEICTGFHLGLGGAQKLFGVTPDLACFGKAMGNGFPISCVVGRAEIMRYFDEVFFSFTFGGEVASMAAAVKVLDILESTDALAIIESSGKALQDGLNVMAEEAGLNERVRCIGRPQWSLVKYLDGKGNEDAVLKNLFQQEAVKRGILILAGHNMTAAHDATAVRETLEAYAAVLKTLACWAQDEKPERYLQGEMSKPVFRVR
jgi:glutamate-1-semialdehyde aminotransferase/spore coat polysaccharide biosynthesis protein SpsF (cytidylyltransferase family)